MGYMDSLREMKPIAQRTLAGLLTHIDPLLVREGDRAWLPYGTLAPVHRLKVTPDEPPSSRLTCDIALGYLAAALATDDSKRIETAFALLRHAFTAQGPDGEFVFNYGQHEIDQVDLGTVLDVYYYFRTYCDDLPADVRDGITQSTRRAIAYLRTMHQGRYPGIIRKRAADPAHPEARRSADYQTIDVLNGNALAATAYCRGAVILNDATLVDRAAMFETNLIERFGAHVPGWWAYTEWLETREMITRETILYQAMTALYLEPLYRARPAHGLADVLAKAMTSLAEITDEDGRLDWSREGVQGFVDTQLLMWPSAAAALADVCDVTDAGLRRLRYVDANLVDGDTGLMMNEDGARNCGEMADELRQIWAISDLALIWLFAERTIHAAAET
jgi:hypothetical protein